MGFRGWLFLCVVLFLSGCGGDKNQTGQYSDSYNQGATPQQGQGQLQQQPPSNDGSAIGPQTDLSNNPILNPSSNLTPPPGNPLSDPRTTNVAPLVQPTPVVARNSNFEQTLSYFKILTVYYQGNEHWAFPGNKAQVLTETLFERVPHFNISKFNCEYRQAMYEGYRGYRAIDLALCRMGIRNIDTGAL